MRSRVNLAWAAGFYEGEGSCRRRAATKLADGRQHGRQTPVISIAQVDREPLDKFKEAVGCGRIYGPYAQANRKNRKPYFVYSTNTFESTQAVMAMMWPWLSTRRKAQMKSAFTQYHLTPLRKSGPKRREAQINA